MVMKRRSRHHDKIEMVAALLQLGCSYGEIGKQLKLSRNSIASIITNYIGRTPKPKQAPKPKHAPKPVKAAIPRAELESAAPAPRKMKLAEPENLRLHMMGLKQDTCRFPHGDGPFVFCGQPSPGENPYCPYHDELTHQAGSAISNRSDAAQKQPSGHPASTS